MTDNIQFRIWTVNVITIGFNVAVSNNVYNSFEMTDSAADLRLTNNRCQDANYKTAPDWLMK